MEKVAIVILNYLNYKDTIECIKSVDNDIYQNKEVVVVDNGSPNESWTELTKYNKENTNFHLVKSNDNSGYAKGNNIGINFAKNQLKCKFVLLVNNDTLFQDKNLISELMKSYKKGIGLIGPRIVAANGLDQNPVPIKANKEVIVYHKKMYHSEIIRNSKIILFINKFKLVKKLKNKIRNDNSSEKSKKSYLLKRDSLNSQCSKELVLHGACIFLTQDYFKYYPYMFPKTFLYYEENIFTILTQKVGLENKFINNVYIYHKEDQSSEMSFKNNNVIKNKFTYESVCYAKKLINLDYRKLIKTYFN